MQVQSKFVAFIVLAWLANSFCYAETGYYRHPSTHDSTLVFTAEGDLWSVPASGGMAQRLTTHHGEESQARISNDGKWIAFAASYDAADEVYVMPRAGGEPKRISFEGGRVWVQGWTADNEVIYATDNIVGPTQTRVIRIVNPSNLQMRELPVVDANEASIDGRGQRLFFSRFGLQISNDNAKQYRGGAMSQLWRFDLAKKAEAVQLAATVKANFKHPMWWQDKLYYVSDESGDFNLWQMSADGESRQQLTHHKGWDVRAASIANGVVVYQLGADIYRYDIANASEAMVPIQLLSDFDQARPRVLKKPLKFVSSAAFSAKADRVVITARGKVSLLGLAEARRIELAIPGSNRARNAVLSADGKTVYAITDISGKNEIWQFAADGSGQGKALTKDGGIHRWNIYPSPDGKKLVHDDKSGSLWLLDLATGKNQKIDQAPHGGDEIYNAVIWSDDSKTLALARPDGSRQLSQIVLMDLNSGQKHTITSDKYESWSPAFSADGMWLYFLSDRHFQSSVGAPWGDRNTGAHFDKRAKVYAVSLQSGSRFPFQNDDELKPPSSDKKADGDNKAEGGKVAPTAIQWSGLAQRLFEVPLPAGNYANVDLDKDRLYIIERKGEDKSALITLSIEAGSNKPEVFAEDVRDFELLAERSKVGFIKSSTEGLGDVFIVPAAAKAPTDLAKSQIKTADWSLSITPKEEWQQMFVDAWRMHKDYSFDPQMRGNDWDAVRAKYQPLLSRVKDRIELDDLLGQMVSNMSILHSQVRGGEFRADAENASAAALGASFSSTGKGVFIKSIYATDPELPSERSPLAKPAVNAQSGDQIIAINGRAINNLADLTQALQDQVSRQVLLQLKRDGAAVHQTIVTPVDMATDALLRYSDWTTSRRQTVERVSDGRIGYLHLRAMGAGDMANFVREFYAQYDRHGLIIDVRRNRGGNIDSWVIEKLLRRTWSFWQPPNTQPYWNMQQTFRGHLVVLIDAMTYSDGETFAAGVKALGLGPLIGMQTSGAGIWLSDGNRLVDGGLARIASAGQFGADGRWLIEGRGVSPDIAVDNLPYATYQGEDAQLDAALQHLAQKLQAEPVLQAKPQPIPSVGEGGQDVH